MLMGFVLSLTSLMSHAEGIFNEDLVWNYVSTNAYHNLEEKILRRYWFSMKYDGVTELDGYIWHNYSTCASSCRVFGYPENIQDPLYEIERFDLPLNVTFLIREESGRYFVRATDSLLSPSSGEFWGWNTQSSDMLLYDFNCNVNDTFTTVNNYGFPVGTNQENPEQTPVSLTVKEIDQIQLLGQQYKMIKTEGFPLEPIAIEGLGWVTECGMLPYLMTNIMMDSGYAFPDVIDLWPNPILEASLLSVTDTEGNVVFKPEMINGSGIEDISSMDSSDTLQRDARIFDMMGREVKAPQPGGIYIRAGRKFVGK